MLESPPLSPEEVENLKKLLAYKTEHPLSYLLEFPGVGAVESRALFFPADLPFRALATIEAQAAEIERLRNALKPFARFWRKCGLRSPGPYDYIIFNTKDSGHYIVLRTENFRRAADAFETGNPCRGRGVLLHE